MTFGGLRGLARIALLIGTAAVGCASSKASQVKANVEAIKREETQEKLVDRGKAFAALGDMTRAEQYFAAALTQGGDEKSIIPLLLTVCVQDGRYRVAIEYAETYLKKHPNDIGVRFVLGTIYAAVGDAESAHGQLQMVLEARPQDAEAHFAFAVLLRDNERDPVGADQHFREYLRLSPRGTHAEEAQASLLKSVP